MTISAIFKSCLVKFSFESTSRKTTSILSIKFITSKVIFASSLSLILFFLLNPGVSKKVKLISKILIVFSNILLVNPDTGPAGERYLLLSVL